MAWAVQRFLTSEEAATAVEYAVLLALILMAAVGAITSFGMANGGLWGGIQQQISTATAS